MYHCSNSKSLSFKNITNTIINNINLKIKEVNKIIEKLESINLLLLEVMNNDCFEKGDKEYIKNSVDHYKILISKYNDINRQNLLEISKINIINTEFTKKGKELKRIETDETEKISNYENNKGIFSETS